MAECQWTPARNGPPRRATTTTRNATTSPFQAVRTKKVPKTRVAEDEIELIRTITPKHEKTFKTCVNFMIVPPRGTTKISIAHSMRRLITSLKPADGKARLVSEELDGNEKEYNGIKALPNDPNAVQEIAHLFLQGLVLTKKRNTLVGMVILRSEVEFKNIIKNVMVLQGLNEEPKIFLRQNKVDTDQENKEQMRTIMKAAEHELQLNEFVAESEFYSLPLPTRKKIVIRQNE